MKISIIVPVYNSEKYISECIESVISQSYSNWELILIDDGSSDHSGDICDKYAAADKRIIVIHKENGGVSSARNVGIENSTGEWITFVDSDDMLLPSCLGFCINEVIKNDLDMLQFLHTRSKRCKYNIYNQPLTSEQFLRIRHNVCVGGGMYKSNLIKLNGIKFPQNIKYAEDQAFVMQCILNATRLEIIDTVLYFYRRNPESATASQINNRAEIYDSCNYLIKLKKLCPKATVQIDNTLLDFIYTMIISGTNDDNKIINLYQNSQIHNCGRVTNGGKILYYLARTINIEFAIKIIRHFKTI